MQISSGLGTALLIAIPLVLIALITAKKRAEGAATRDGRKATGELSAKQPLTEREQAMYFRLTKTLPEHVVLAQVAFSALLTTKDKPTRATFDRKVADFVLCDKAFTVLAAIELDDASHRDRQAHDAARDALLTKAGIRVMRFKNVPDADVLLQAVAKLAPKP